MYVSYMMRNPKSSCFPLAAFNTAYICGCHVEGNLGVWWKLNAKGFQLYYNDYRLL